MPGANAQCIPADIDAQIELIERADIVLMQMEIPLATVTYAAKVAKLLQKTVILNPAPAQKLPPELLACVDYLTPNETELSILIEGESDLEGRMDALLKQGVRHVVATLGEQGVAYKAQAGSLLHISGHQVPIVDTTGAGDAFNASFSNCNLISVSFSGAIMRETGRGTLYYKFEIKTTNRKVDVYVDAMTGEAWRENDPERMKQRVKISLEEAKKIALNQVKGTIVKAKLDEDDGQYLYEVEMRTDQWREVEFEISATTGDVLDVDWDD